MKKELSPDEKEAIANAFWVANQGRDKTYELDRYLQQYPDQTQEVIRKIKDEIK